MRSNKTAVIFTLYIISFTLFFHLDIAFTQDAVVEPVGKVVAVRGKAFAVNIKSVKRLLTIKAPVYLHDTIKTTQGRIQIIFKDKTIITLGKKTKMEITRYIWEPGNKGSAMETRVDEGSFRIMGGSITRTDPQNFKTNTPSGTIGIRGSMYAGLINGNNVKVIYQGGTGAFFTNKFGSVNLDRPGFFTEVKGRTSAPAKPKKASPALLRELDNSFVLSPARISLKPTPEKAAPDSPEPDSPEPGEPVALKKPKPGTSQSEPPNPLPDISSVVSDTILISNQTKLDASVDPSTAESKVLLSLLNLGFTGNRSLSVPSTGISIYKGRLENDLITEASDNIKFSVNWANGRVMFFEDTASTTQASGSGFGFGSVTATGGIERITALGSGGYPGTTDIYAFTGSGTFGQFYGPGQNALGIAMEGYDINLRNSSDQKFWKDIAASTLLSKSTSTYTGQHLWEGFFIGVGEDMNNTSTGHRVFTNALASEFTLTIEKDDGTLSGSMSGNDFNNAGNTINSLSIGGSVTEPEKSVFIDDKTMGAELNGSSAITINSYNGGIKSYGNFMFTSDKTQLSGYTTWGYWETAYSEPGTGKDYHIHVPGAFWISGKPTPSTEISSRIGGTFQGTYTGLAKGIKIDSTGITKLTNGATSLFIDFDAANQVTGSISFTEQTLAITSSSNVISTSGFTATVVGASSSRVAGTFYGPYLEGVGGNFSADISGTQYHGIFAGDK